MNEIVKKRWIGLLESGEYNLGKNMLYNKRNDTHCPLGVLVEMGIDENVIEPKVAGISTRFLKDVDGFRLNGALLGWSGLTSEQTSDIACINDAHGAAAAIAAIKKI